MKTQGLRKTTIARVTLGMLTIASVTIGISLLLPEEPFQAKELEKIATIDKVQKTAKMERSQRLNASLTIDSDLSREQKIQKRRTFWGSDGQIQLNYPLAAIALLSTTGTLLLLNSIGGRIQGNGTDRDRSLGETGLWEKTIEALGEAPDLDSALSVALHNIGVATGWDYGEIWIPSGEESELKCSPIWYDKNGNLNAFREQRKSQTVRPHWGLPGRVMALQQSEWVSDLSQEPESWSGGDRLALEWGFKAGFGIPILVEGYLLGVLVFFQVRDRTRDRRTILLVSSIALQIASVTGCKQAIAELQEAESKYRQIVENAREGIFQIGPDGEYISVNPALAQIYGYESPEELIASWYEEDSQRYVYPHCFYESIRLLQQQDIVSGFEAQVYRRDGSMMWISQNARAVCDRDGKLLYYEGSVKDVTERKWTEEQLRYNASHDALTGLWNRAFFMDRLVKAVSRAQTEENYGFAVLFMDLDDFKLVNDSLGHAIGDRLLMAIGGRLENCLRQGDTLARFGGDEFTVLMDEIAGVEEAIFLARQIQEIFSQSFNLGGYEVFTGVSIGIVHSTGGDRVQPDFLRDADTAMYRAKAQGKGCYVVFDAQMRTQAMQRLQLETDLRWAIERGEFEMYYQPIVRLGTEQISGFEALMRWKHPQKGWISPSEFIPVAEETGAIERIGEWALREACTQLRIWKKQFPTYPSLKMSVNLSGKQLTEELCDRIDRILLETGVEGWDLKLEITETALVADRERTIPLLDRLKQRDIQLCIDDFGTGYSSLSYLHRLPIDILKIDRSFVMQMSAIDDDAEIVRTIVALAHALGMDAIAEGIENIEQVRHLQLLKCKYGQGYFFSPPLNGEAAGLLLARGYLGDDRDLQIQY